MLKVYVGNQLAGSLFKPESDPNKHHFGYDEHCPPQSAVSLSMPVVNVFWLIEAVPFHRQPNRAGSAAGRAAPVVAAGNMGWQAWQLGTDDDAMCKAAAGFR